MPQVRDPKTGRYTSGGGSSVGGAAGTNPRIQKAAAVGAGAVAGGGASATVQNTKNTSYDQATKMFNAKTGTVIELTQHTSGDYVGEYTKTDKGWSGSQKYKSGYTKPADVTTANGFAMRVQGMDVKVVKQGATAGGGQSYKSMRYQESIEMMSPRASRAFKTMTSNGTSREVLSKYNKDISDTEKRLKSEKNTFRQTVLAQELVTLKKEKAALSRYAEDYALL